MAAANGFDRVNVADDVGHGDIGRRKFFDEARVALNPRDGRLVAVALNRLPPVGRDRMKRIVVDFGTRDDGNPFVEQVGQLTDDAALGLPAQAEQDQIVPRENRVDDLRHDRLVIADDAGKDSFARAQFAQEVGAQFVFDRSGAVAALSEFAEGVRQFHFYYLVLLSRSADLCAARRSVVRRSVPEVSR